MTAWPAANTDCDADGTADADGKAAGEFAAPRGANGVLGPGDSPAGAGLPVPGAGWVRASGTGTVCAVDTGGGAVGSATVARGAAGTVVVIGAAAAVVGGTGGTV